MLRALAGLLVVLSLAACEHPSEPTPGSAPPQPPAQQAAPQPAPPAPLASEAADESLADAPQGDDEGPPPLEWATEPRREDHLRVLVLSGGGYHDFAGNLTRLQAGVASRVSVTFT